MDAEGFIRLAQTDSAIRARLLAALGVSDGPDDAEIRRQCEDTLQTFLKTKKPTTVEAYTDGLTRFARFLGVPSNEEALAQVLTMKQGALTGLAIRFQDRLTKEYAPASVNLRLASLKSIVKCARSLGYTTNEIIIKPLSPEPTKSTEGPSHDKIVQCLKELEVRGSCRTNAGAIALRDAAVIALLYFNALRKSEVLCLDMEHVDLAKGKVSILGKGRRKRQEVTLSGAAKKILAAWLKRRADIALSNEPLSTGTPTKKTLGQAAAEWPAERQIVPKEVEAGLASLAAFVDFAGADTPLSVVSSEQVNAFLMSRTREAGQRVERAYLFKFFCWTQMELNLRSNPASKFATGSGGPVFITLGGRKWQTRLDGQNLVLIIKGYDLIRPHALRHSAAVRAHEQSGGDLYKVQQFLRHSDPSTTTLYIKTSRDVAGDVAKLMGE
jgi:site-specific recombinase XerC